MCDFFLDCEAADYLQGNVDGMIIARQDDKGRRYGFCRPLDLWNTTSADMDFGTITADEVGLVPLDTIDSSNPHKTSREQSKQPQNLVSLSLPQPDPHETFSRHSVNDFADSTPRCFKVPTDV